MVPSLSETKVGQKQKDGDNWCPSYGTAPHNGENGEERMEDGALAG